MSGRAIATANDLAARMTPDQDERYGDLLRATTAHAAAFTRAGMSADAAAKTIARAVTARRPRTRYTIGRDAAVLTRVARLLPDRALDRMLAANLRPHYPKASAA
jgi:hypothetical protein